MTVHDKEIPIVAVAFPVTIVESEIVLEARLEMTSLTSEAATKTAQNLLKAVDDLKVS